jgi:two-component sensor histidine kinase
MMAIQHPATGYRVVIAGGPRSERLRRAFARRGRRADMVPVDHAMNAVDDTVDAVLVAAPRRAALALCRRLKTRFQMPLLPVLVVLPRPRRLTPEPTAPDAWLPPDCPPRDVVARVDELVRIRDAERQMVRLNSALAELAAENGRLYDRARRDAEATTLLLRELQHRVRNNLAAIQALLVLERHRRPPRHLSEALDVAIARLRSMAALQDSLTPGSNDVELAVLARTVATSALEVFGASDRVRFEVSGDVRLPARVGSSLAIVLNELVTNALKHAHAHRVRVEVSERERELGVVVADDGCGMATEPTNGSGLMIVRAVVANELSGQVSIEPAEAGTRVAISIPRERAGDRSAAG